MKEETMPVIKRAAKTDEHTLAGAAGLHLSYAILGFLFARTPVFGSLLPFGAAAAAAAPEAYLLSTLFGSAMGYALPLSDGTGGLRYIAAVLMIVMLRRLLPVGLRMKGCTLSMIFAFGTCLATSIAVLFIGSASFMDGAMLLAEAMLAGGTAYFLERFLRMIGTKNSFRELSQYELTSLVITLAVALMSLTQFQIAGISPARIAAAVLVLIAARYGRQSAGAVTGVVTGFAMSLTGDGLSHLMGSFGVGGLLAGAFAPLGTLPGCAAFLLVNAIVSIGSGLTMTVMITIYEITIATVLFLAMPKAWGQKLAGLFAPKSAPVKVDGFKKSVLMRMDFAAHALRYVSESVEAVAYKLHRMTEPAIDEVYAASRDKLCRSCENYEACWKKEEKKRAADFRNMGQTLRSFGRMEAALLPEGLAESCVQRMALCKTVSDEYTDFVQRESGSRRIDEVRSVIVEQFVSMSDIIEELSAGIDSSDRVDEGAEERIGSLLRDIGIETENICCGIDNNGHMLIEIRTKAPAKRFSRKYMTEEISRACGRAMGAMNITEAGGEVLITLSEKAPLRAQFGAAQHVCNNAEYCGDCFEYFQDGRGRAMMIISDGMGSGGRAAVDGAMGAGLLSRLLKAGFGYDSSLKIVNSAMLFKSSDESLTTIDLVSLDLYSGRTEFLKAGAPVTFIRRGKRVSRLSCDSLPVGILKETTFERKSMSLGAGDVIVMVSDGAIEEGEEWLIRRLESWDGDNAQELAELLGSEAKLQRIDRHDDDITVVAMRVEAA